MITTFTESQQHSLTADGDCKTNSMHVPMRLMLPKFLAKFTYQQYGIHVLYSTRPNQLQYSYEYVRCRRKL